MTMTRRAVTIAAAVLTFVFALAGTTFGHAELVSSDPSEGGSLEHTPYTMTATFTEVLTPDGSSLVVRNSAGAEVASGTVSPDDTKTMSVELPVLDPGQYIARWTAVTADDLAVERGTITFTVAPQPSCTDDCTGSPSPAPTPSAIPSTTATARPANSAPVQTALPSPAPLPSASGSPTTPTSGSSDVLLALVIAAVVIGAIAIFLFRRSHR